MKATLSLKKYINAVRETTPLVHNITNYVTVNDCANALLGIGASPIMSDEPKDVVDITSICSGLTINIGTLNAQSIEAMFLAGNRAAELGHPIVLDPVGAGASMLRTTTASDLLDRLPIAIIKGNMSEAKAIAKGASSTHGVDVCPDDMVCEENLSEGATFACDLAATSNAVVAITGPIDIVADANSAYAIRNGSPLQGKITGSGCMLACMCAAFAVAAEKSVLEATVAAVSAMGLAGQQAQERMSAVDGNGSYRTYLLDALYKMDGAILEAGAEIEKVR